MIRTIHWTCAGCQQSHTLRTGWHGGVGQPGGPSTRWLSDKCACGTVSNFTVLCDNSGKVDFVKGVVLGKENHYE